MAGTFNIPLVTLPPGSRDFPATGGFAIADGDTVAVLTIDRTVTGGLNAVPATTSVSIATWQSNDGGASWTELSSATAAGGVYNVPPKYGSGIVSSFLMGVSLAYGTSRLARAHVTVSGSSVAVQGSLVIS